MRIDYTLNPWWGCTRVSPGCDHCYAEALDARTGGAHWGKGVPRRTFGDKAMSPTDRPSGAAPEVEVVPYREPLREDFARLNRQWIEQHFRLEQADLDSFADPHVAFVAPGGEVFFTLVDGQGLGTCALRKESEDTYELCKMAVAPEARGRGLGDVLIRAVIDAARARGARTLRPSGQ